MCSDVKYPYQDSLTNGNDWLCACLLFFPDVAVWEFETQCRKSFIWIFTLDWFHIQISELNQHPCFECRWPPQVMLGILFKIPELGRSLKNLSLHIITFRCDIWVHNHYKTVLISLLLSKRYKDIVHFSYCWWSHSNTWPFVAYCLIFVILQKY